LNGSFFLRSLLVIDPDGLGAKLAARERLDDRAPVRVNDLKLDGKSVKFSVVRDGRRADYSGVAAETNTINGTVTVTAGAQANEFVWKATREPTTKGPAPK